MKPSAAWRGWVLPLGLLALAEAGMRLDAVQSDSLARPSEVLGALARTLGDGSLFAWSGQTLATVLAGFLIGGGLGLAAGFWFGMSRLAGQAAALSLELLHPIPAVALIPLSMLAFGFGFRMEIALVAFTCFWPLLLLLTQAAVRGIEPRLLEVGRLLGLSPTERLRKIILPSALPRVFVACRLGMGFALVVAVTVEIVANPQGLGHALASAQQSLQPDLMFAVVAWIGLLGWCQGAALLRLQRRWFRHAPPLDAAS